MPHKSARSTLGLPSSLLLAATLCLGLYNTLFAKPKPGDIPAVAIVTFQVADQPEAGALRSLLENTGQKYTQIPGLIRKYFIAAENQAGGIYEWESMSLARAFYDETWYRNMITIYGIRPEVVFFESPAIADGVNHELHIYLPDEERSLQ